MNFMTTQKSLASFVNLYSIVACIAYYWSWNAFNYPRSFLTDLWINVKFYFRYFGQVIYWAYWTFWVVWPWICFRVSKHEINKFMLASQSDSHFRANNFKLVYVCALFHLNLNHLPAIALNFASFSSAVKACFFLTPFLAFYLASHN